MGKLISVIIPCYNVEEYIRRCFLSLVHQTIGIDQLEIIMLDDCSTDNTWEVLVELEKEYPESVIIIHNDKNCKPGMYRNIGLNYATTPYIAYIDADDWVEPVYCQRLYEKMLEFDCDIVSCCWWRDFGNGKKHEISGRMKPENNLIEIDSIEKRKFVFVNDLLGSGAWCKLIRKDFLLENNIFFPEGIVFEDVVWGALNYLHIKRIYILDEYLYHYYVNPKSIVLKEQQLYYRDMFETNYIKWEQLQSRGALETMKWEAEFDFLVNYYLGILKMFGMRYEEIPVEAFEEVQQFILANIPDYNKNPYIKTNLRETAGMLFSFIDKKMGKEELKQLHSVIKKIGL